MDVVRRKVREFGMPRIIIIAFIIVILIGALLEGQDMAALMGNFLERYDHPGQPVTNQAPGFADADAVADYAAEGVTECYRMGLMSGKAGNLFDPLATATRAEVTDP